MEKAESHVYQVAVGDQYVPTHHPLPAGSGAIMGQSQSEAVQPSLRSSSSFSKS